MFDSYDFIEKGGQQVQYQSPIQSLNNINIAVGYGTFQSIV
jgi:hypothetical protein